MHHLPLNDHVRRLAGGGNLTKALNFWAESCHHARRFSFDYTTKTKVELRKLSHLRGMAE
jgi:hypothetical protein